MRREDEPDDQTYRHVHGRCNVALHNGTSVIGSRAPKPVFFSQDVAAARERLVKRGAKRGKVKSKNGLDLCEGKDPDGIRFKSPIEPECSSPDPVQPE
jgi:hypothetical protein